MTHRQKIANFFQDVWIDGRTEAIDLHFATEAGATGLVPEMAVDRADFHVFVNAVRALVIVDAVDILQAVCEGEWISALVKVHCTCRDTGRSLSLTGQAILRYRDDKITEAHNTFDLMALFIGLDLLPADAMLHLLSGEAIG